MLLFISRDDDLHTDHMEAECDRRGVPYLRLCTQDYPTEVQISLELNGATIEGSIRTPRCEAPLNSIQGIWYRRPEAPRPSPFLDQEYVKFVQRESKAALRGLYRTLWDKRWVNPPHNEEAAGYKVHQLQLAKEVGFKTPKTIVTNNPAEALDFYRACGGGMIYKLMRPVFAETPDGMPVGVYTTPISQDDIDTYLESVRVAPCLFQELIPKQYELRINVIGTHVWSAAVYSQENDGTKIDCRYDIENCRHAPVLIPPALEAMCLQMTRCMGLRMSNIDMILTPDGEYVYLETNPNGQWAWIEQYTGLPLTTALIDELTGIDTLADHPYTKDRSLDF
jgi:glutathione synthase/RimK-type ligase-like ATP-grasp enzyme